MPCKNVPPRFFARLTIPDIQMAPSDTRYSELLKQLGGGGTPQANLSVSSELVKLAVRAANDAGEALTIDNPGAALALNEIVTRLVDCVLDLEEIAARGARRSC
jgi:hypothetical protein